MLDKDAFEAFRESGDLFNKKIAGDFRRKILARGGSEDGMTMYRDFRGKDPDKRAMLRGRGLLNEPEPSGEDAISRRRKRHPPPRETETRTHRKRNR